jgi:hypothetical protein
MTTPQNFELALECIFKPNVKEKPSNLELKILVRYIVVASPLSKVSEASLQERLGAERNPATEGRLHFRFIDTPVTFGCVFSIKDTGLSTFHRISVI